MLTEHGLSGMCLSGGEMSTNSRVYEAIRLPNSTTVRERQALKWFTANSLRFLQGSVYKSTSRMNQTRGKIFHHSPPSLPM
jgi:hypothetical protein